MTMPQTSQAEATLTVTIVGAGPVGRALGTNLLGHGHRVRYAVRDNAVSIPSGAATVPIDGCATGTDLTILAVPFGVVADVVPRLGLRTDDVLIDATNPFGAAVPDGHTSGAAYIQSLAGSEVHVAKTFGVLGVEHMAEPVLSEGVAPILPVVADDDGVRDQVVRLARQMGFDAVPVGGLANAGTLEHAALYWGLLALTAGLGREVVLVAHRRG
jgi:8-hydroxy-5-deazaflavin:NADPH oxidoreductase